MNFEWFLDTYDRLNNPKRLSELDTSILDQITKLYRLYENDYKLFIENVFQLLNINEKDKLIYLKQEKYCIYCIKNYPITLDPFLTILNQKEEDITHQICSKCLPRIKLCNICRCDPDPYNTIYFVDNKLICLKCYKK
jgi:hypothetical protein